MDGHITFLTHRAIAHRAERPAFLLYTDSAFANDRGSLGNVLANEEAPIFGTHRAIDMIIAAPVAPARILMFRATSAICGLGLLAVTLALYQLRRKLAGRPVLVFIDNNAALGAIVKGKTEGDPAHSFITAMWTIAATLSITLWFERVPSAVKVADLPPRRQLPGYPVLMNTPYIELTEWAGVYKSHFNPLFDFASIESPNSVCIISTIFPRTLGRVYPARRSPGMTC